MRSGLATASLIAVVAALSGCGTTAREPEIRQRALSSSEALPPAPAAAAALAQITDGPEARGRLAYVNLARIAELRSAVAPASVLRETLGDTAPERLPSTGALTAVRVGAATVIRGPGVRELTGASGARRSGSDGLVFGGDTNLRTALADPRPEVSAIAPPAQSAVQSCLGDAAAQTILGPAVMGRDGALGVGLRVTQDPPAGVQLAVCYAPHLRRELHRAEHRAEKRFGALDVPRARRPVIREIDIGERDMLSVVLPADAIGGPRVLALLRGGRALRLLAGRG